MPVSRSRPPRPRQDGSGDIVGSIGCQEQDRLRLLIQGAVAVHEAAGIGLVNQGLIPDFFLFALRLGVPWRQPGGRGGFGATRRGGVHPDAVLGILKRQVHSHGVHPPTLGGA